MSLFAPQAEALPDLRRQIRNLLWWLGYFMAALWLQLQFPGLDALLPGFVIALQEKRWQQIFWVAAFCILVQEGTGTLEFGSAILWYGSLSLLFLGGRWFFLTNSLFFIVLLSAAMGAVAMILLYAMTSLQQIPLPMDRMLKQCAAQALLIPPLWGLALLSRKRILRNATDGI